MVMTYESLRHVTKTTSPYRGTVNKFPYDKRAYSYKSFISDTHEDEHVYRIHYGKTYQRVVIDPSEIKLYENLGRNVQKQYGDDTRPFYYQEKPNEIGIVRADNTMEFTADYLGQGTCQILDSKLRGWFFRDSRRGGYVTNGWSGNITPQPLNFHPMFRGIRINLDTHEVHESTKYRLFGRRVNRKASKELTRGYENMFKVSNAMLKQIDYDNCVIIAAEVMSEALSIDLLSKEYLYVPHSPENEAKLIERAESLVSTAPLDAMILFGIASGVQGLGISHIKDQYKRLIEKDAAASYYRRVSPEGLYDNIKRKFSTIMYNKHPEVFNTVEFEMGKQFPASNWGFTVTVNDKEVERY